MKTFTSTHGGIETIYNLSEIPNAAGDLVLTISDRARRKIITFRNVGEQNPASQIQFTVESYNNHTNRTQYITFDIPADLVETFIKHLSKPR